MDVRGHYKGYAEHYQGGTMEFAAKVTLDRQVAAVLHRHLATVDEGTFLEAFAGPGPIARRLHPRGIHCVGIDNSEEMIKSFPAWCPRAGDIDMLEPDTLTFRSNVLRLTGDKPVDAVSMVNGFYMATANANGLHEAQAKRLQVVRNLASVMNTGALMVVSDPLEKGKDRKSIYGVLKYAYSELTAAARLSKTLSGKVINIVQSLGHAGSPAAHASRDSTDALDKVCILMSCLDEQHQLLVKEGYFEIDPNIPQSESAYFGQNTFAGYRRTSKKVLET